jgi:CDP-paratose synthetase
MRLLLTGVTGYIGKQTAAFLTESGYEVHALARKLPGGNDFKQGAIQYHLISESTIKDIVCNVQPDIVIHIASKFLATHNYDDIEDLIYSNITFPTLLLDAMSNASVENFINTGTSWQNYNSEDYNPVNLYAATKQAFEDVVKYYTNTNKIKSITLKIFDSYGPRDTRGKLVSLLDRLALTKEVLAMSPGEQKVSLVHVDDICRAFEQCVKRIYQEPLGYNAIFGLPGRESVSLKELVGIYEASNDCKLNIIWGGREYREREVMSPAVNIATLPDWTPQIPLCEGLDRSKRS